MTAKERVDPAAVASARYGDGETTAASGVPLPSLRVLQAAGAIRSQKVAKPHGGFRRTWPEEDVGKASIAAAIGEHFAWNIRIVSEAMAKTHPGTWDALVATSGAGLEASATGATILVRALDQDWHLELVDRKFLFLKVPEVATTILPDTIYGQTNLLLGMVRKDGFMAIPWAFGSPQRQAGMKAAVGQDGYQTTERLYRVAMAARNNFLSKATINLSMQVRMASHRLQGRKAYFVQEMIQPRKRDTDP